MLVEWYTKKNLEILGQRPVPVPLVPEHSVRTSEILQCVFVSSLFMYPSEYFALWVTTRISKNDTQRRNVIHHFNSYCKRNGIPLSATLLYLRNALYWHEDDRLRSKNVAVMWPDCIYFITVMICFVYWRYIMHYTNLLIHNGMASVKSKEESGNTSIHQPTNAHIISHKTV